MRGFLWSFGLMLALAAPTAAETVDGSRIRDRFGSTLARLSTAQGDVGEAPTRRGLALPWRAGAKARAARLRAWCGP